MRRVSHSDNPVLREQLPAWRSRLVLMLLMAAFIVLAGRALYVQVVSTEFLQQQGERRYERTLTLSATRGKILDRNGVVLASSVPARAIWAIPDDAKPATAEQLSKLAKMLGLSTADLRSRLDVDRNFVYLKRQVSVDLADQIKKLEVPGIYQQAETRRFYPDGGVTAHLVGFTSVEDKGQEGVELAFDSLLSGTAGSRRVIKDRLGRVIEDVQAMTAPVNGRDLNLSIDARLQYLVYRELSEAVQRHQAQAASAVIMDVKTGEILALASLPTYDPNDRDTYHAPNLRNRTITDTFEPGSIMKPFTVALALDLQRISPKTQFDTGNGSFRYQGATIHDVSRHNGTLNAAGVLRRSSNIGMTLISEKLQSREMWERFTELGFGRAPQLGFPGAAPGRLRPWDRWRLIEKATMSYGYGLSVSLLQMARAYSVFARDGEMVAPTLVKRDSEPTSVKVYSPEVAVLVRSMLEDAAGPEGAKAAQVQGYRVAGKSGTARKIIDGKYSKRYRSSFVGFAPVSNPRIIVAVSLDDPTAGGYFGGAVAAPIFSTIMGGSLRLMGVQPDAPFESTIVAGVREGAR